MINKVKLRKMLLRAQEKIAFEKLGYLKNFVFYDKERKRYRLSYNMFVKKGEDKSEAQKAEIERIETLCSECGIDAEVLIFIDDLGDEFADGTE